MRLAAGLRWRMGRGGGRELGDRRRRRDFGLSSASRRVVRRSRGTHAICSGSSCSGSDRRRGRRAVARWNGGREWFRRDGSSQREVCGQSAFAALTRLGRNVGAGRRERCVDRERTARRHTRGGAKVKGAFASQPPDSRRLGARGNGCAAGLGSRRFRCSRGERRRVSAACEPSSIAEAARNANGNDARSAPSLSSECLVDCSGADSSCRGSSEGCGGPSAAEAPAFVAAPGIESSTAAKAKRSAGGWGDARGAGGAIGPEAGAAAGAVMASLHFVSAQGSTCAGAQLALARSSARARWLYSCRRRLKRRGPAY